MGQYRRTASGALHKIAESDVRAAFADYQALTGDHTARLRREGRRYWIEGAWGMEASGAHQAWALILAFVAGWKARGEL